MDHPVIMFSQLWVPDAQLVNCSTLVQPKLRLLNLTGGTCWVSRVSPHPHCVFKLHRGKRKYCGKPNNDNNLIPPINNI